MAGTRECLHRPRKCFPPPGHGDAVEEKYAGTLVATRHCITEFDRMGLDILFVLSVWPDRILTASSAIDAYY